MRTIVSAKRTEIAAPEPLNIGGTGANNAADALINLGGVSIWSFEAANGVAALVNSKVQRKNIPPNAMVPQDTVQVASNVFPYETFVGQPVKFLITNYDYQRDYALSAVGGTIDLVTHEDYETCVGLNGAGSCTPSGSLIYTPTSNAGIGSFTLNGRLFEVTIKDPYMDKPVIISPVNNEVITTASMALTANTGNYHTGNYGWNSGIVRYQYELAEDVNFTLNVNTVTNDYASISEVITNLVTNKLYYIRVRNRGWYYDNNFNMILMPWSEWSDTVSFTTNINMFPVNVVSILHNQDSLSEGKQFGTTVVLSKDNSVLLIGDDDSNLLTADYANGVNTEAGAIFIYQKINNVWTYQHVMRNPTLGQSIPFNTHSTGFGLAMKISPNNQWIFAIENNRIINDVIESSGILRIYETPVAGDFSSTFLKQSIVPHDTVDGLFQNLNITTNTWSDRGEELIAISDDSTILAFSAYSNNSSSAVFIYVLQNGLFVQRDIIHYPNYGNYWGADIKLSNDGNVLTVINSRDGAGLIYIYNYNGTTWNLTTTLDVNNELPGHFDFGKRISINSTGTLLAASAYKIADTCDHIFIYELINGIWTRVQDILPVQWSNTELGGEADIIRMSEDGQYIFIGSCYQSTPATVAADGAWNSVGAALVYKRVNGIYELFHNYYPDRTADIVQYSMEFGRSLSFNRLINTVAIGAPEAKLVADSLNGGLVYIYE